MEEKIVLTESNDVVLVTFQGQKVLPQDVRLGDHIVCGGHIYLLQTSNTHRALLCHRCQLRIPVPNTANTVALLQEHFKKFQPSEQPATS